MGILAKHPLTIKKTNMTYFKVTMGMIATGLTFLCCVYVVYYYVIMPLIKPFKK